MDFADRDLFQLLSSGYPTGLPSKLHRRMNRTRAVGYLHRQGIVHRDIKPENILVAGQDIKLCDFGFSVQSRMATEFVGSPGFFAPEVLLTKSYDAFRADVWSLGVVILETLIGTHAFDTIWLKAYAVLEKPLFAVAITKSILNVDRDLTFDDANKDALRLLLIGTLKLDPEHRLTIDAVVANKWLLEIPKVVHRNYCSSALRMRRPCRTASNRRILVGTI